MINFKKKLDKFKQSLSKSGEAFITISIEYATVDEYKTILSIHLSEDEFINFCMKLLNKETTVNIYVTGLLKERSISYLYIRDINFDMTVIEENKI